MAKPLLFITGFLGAGKTTLLRSLIIELQKKGLTADVILNDYENADIDAATLPDYACSIAPIAASCACCDSLDDLVQLCLAAQDSEGDILLIELNGTADPLPLLEVFTLLETKIPFFPRWQASVVDARSWGKRGEFSKLEERQVETATHWVLTHGEKSTEDDTARLIESVAKVNPYAQRVDRSALAEDLASLIGAEFNPEEEPLSEEKHCADATHDHEHGLSHRFTGCQFPLPGRFRGEQIVRFLEELPTEVVRAKALVKLRESPGSRWLFERVGTHPVESPQQVNEIKQTPASLVCIGPQLSPEKIRGLVKDHFGI